MHEEVIISGFGGQGSLFAGQLMTYAGLEEGKYVTWIPSYGPEMRGGTAHCTVVISDDPVGSPIIRNPTAVIALNPPSMDKYEPLIKPGGVLVLNSSLIHRRPTRKDITVIEIPANDIAHQEGDVKMANMALLGALLAARAIVSLESIKQVLDTHLPERRRHIIEPNKRVLMRGAEMAKSQQKTC